MIEYFCDRCKCKLHESYVVNIKMQNIHKHLCVYCSNDLCSFIATYIDNNCIDHLYLRFEYILKSFKVHLKEHNIV